MTTETKQWCTHCQDHYERNHYDSTGHLIGKAYGRTGELLAEERSAEHLREIIKTAIHAINEDGRDASYISEWLALCLKLETSQSQTNFPYSRDLWK